MTKQTIKRQVRTIAAVNTGVFEKPVQVAEKPVVLIPKYMEYVAFKDIEEIAETRSEPYNHIKELQWLEVSASSSATIRVSAMVDGLAITMLAKTELLGEMEVITRPVFFMRQRGESKIVTDEITQEAKYVLLAFAHYAEGLKL